MKKNKFIVITLLISLGLACRLLPHAWNFTPIAAIAMFSGAYLGRRAAIAVPLAAMLLGDIFLGFYSWRIMVPVYLSFAAAGGIGILVGKYKNVETVLAGAIMSSVLFFAVTNLAVWLWSPLYARTLSGLAECYAMAIPFLKNTVLGNLFYSAVLFGGYEAALSFAGKKRRILHQADARPKGCSDNFMG